MAEKPALSILKSPCDECPFKGRFEIRPGRLKDIVNSTTKSDSYFSCHKTLDGRKNQADAVFGNAAVCAGWLEVVRKLRRVPTVIQIAERLGFVEMRKPV